MVSPKLGASVGGQCQSPVYSPPFQKPALSPSSCSKKSDNNSDPNATEALPVAPAPAPVKCSATLQEPLIKDSDLLIEDKDKKSRQPLLNRLNQRINDNAHSFNCDTQQIKSKVLTALREIKSQLPKADYGYFLSLLSKNSDIWVDFLIEDSSFFTFLATTLKQKRLKYNDGYNDTSTLSFMSVLYRIDEQRGTPIKALACSLRCQFNILTSPKFDPYPGNAVHAFLFLKSSSITDAESLFLLNQAKSVDNKDWWFLASLHVNMLHFRFQTSPCVFTDFIKQSISKINSKADFYSFILDCHDYLTGMPKALLVSIYSEFDSNPSYLTKISNSSLVKMVADPCQLLDVSGLKNFYQALLSRTQNGAGLSYQWLKEHAFISSSDLALLVMYAFSQGFSNVSGLMPGTNDPDFDDVNSKLTNKFFDTWFPLNSAVSLLLKSKIKGSWGQNLKYFEDVKKFCEQSFTVDAPAVFHYVMTEFSAQDLREWVLFAAIHKQPINYDMLSRN